jgi:hypothetical protein
MTELALAAVLLMAASPAPKLSTMEQRYVEARDAATARYSKGPMAGDEQAMGGLEVQLREIVGPVRLPGLASPGKLAYDGFWGVGSIQADGLVFDWSGNTLFVTTRGLYMRAVGALRPTKDPSVEDEMVSRTIMVDVAFVTFADLPVRKVGSTKRVRAVVGSAAQAYGPWPPNSLIVQVERGERVFVVCAELKPPLEQVDDCEATFNAAMKKFTGRDRGDMERLQFNAYRRCAGSALPSRPSFAAVLGRAQAIVDQLEAGDAEGSPTGR